MNVLEIVTWVAPGNPFGGPLRVATNLADELRSRGHRVIVAAAQPGRDARGNWSAADQGVAAFDAVRVIPGAGFSGITSLRLLRHVWRTCRSFDIVHVHLARDLVTLPAAWIAQRRGVPVMVQCHGMVDASTRRSAHVLDRLLTKRVLTAARAVYVLTEHERDHVQKAFPKEQLRFEVLQNGVPTPAQVPSSPPHEKPQVLFCSRLHMRKRPAWFAEMAMLMLELGEAAQFTIVGSDEGALAEVSGVLARSTVGAAVTVEPAVEPRDVSARLSACDIFVLPSVDEPFPMVVLEALAAGRPVIVTDTCGLAPFVETNDCGIVVPGDDLDALVNATHDLIADPARRGRMGSAGRAAVSSQLSMAAIGDRVEVSYRRAIDEAGICSGALTS